MKRTRIVKLLNILSEAEKALLAKHIKHSDKDVEFKALANYLLTHTNQPELLAHEQIIKAINPKLSEEKLGQLRFQLFQFVENLVLNNWLNTLPKEDTEHQVQKDFMLLEYYKTKELPGSHKPINDLSKLIEFKQKQIAKLLDKRQATNINHYYYLHRLNYHQYYGLNASILAKGKDYIQAAMQHLDLFYGLAKFKFAGELQLRNMFTAEQTDIFGLDEMSTYCNALEFDNKELFVKQPIIRLYQLSSRLANKTNKTNLNLLKDALIQYEHKLDDKELSQLLTLVINYNTYISRHNNIDLSETSYELLKLGLKREIFNVNGLIRPDFLINFAYLCSAFSDDTEITLLMKQYESRLAAGIKESTFNLCKAFIFWYRKEYKKAIAVTKMKPKRTFVFFLYQKLIQIKCLYELNEINKLDIENDHINDMLSERNGLLKYLR